MNYTESIKIALGSIRANLLRSFLTLFIIAIGITCLVGILTAIDGILFSMSDSFNKLGANAFSIRPATETIKSSSGGRRRMEADPINYKQALEFKEKYNFGGTKISLETFCTGDAAIKFKDKKTNPTVRVIGINENYLSASAFELSEGRNYTASEVSSVQYRVILGADLVKQLFDDKPEKAIGQDIFINSDRYKIIGTLKAKGAAAEGSSDRRVFIPLYTSKVKYGYDDKSYNLSVAVNNPNIMDEAISSSITVMRNARGLKISEANDFEIRKSDGILNQLKDMTSMLRWATIIIATLTLLGASIGLMNIMLVSVTERTKEIGIRKAVGATKNSILSQFLIEASVICILGGLLGILLGLLMGVGVTAMVGGKFFVPWNWMLLGITVCIIVGLISGLYPALKAAQLDPIEALRYE
jgi:putative ABC transport system permease protein